MAKKSGITVDVKLNKQNLERTIEKGLNKSLQSGTLNYRCPNCGTIIAVHKGLNHCPSCNQAIEVDVPKVKL